MQEECEWVYVVIITVHQIQYTNHQCRSLPFFNHMNLANEGKSANCISNLTHYLPQSGEGQNQVASLSLTIQKLYNIYQENHFKISYNIHL